MGDNEGAKELVDGGLWVAGGGLDSEYSTENVEGQWMSKSCGIWWSNKKSVDSK